MERSQPDQTVNSALPDRAIALARTWARDSAEVPVPRSHLLMGSVLSDPGGMETALGFVDGVLRPDDPKVMARNLAKLGHGSAADAFPVAVRAGIRLGVLAPVAPHVAAPLAQAVARKLVGHLVVDAGRDPLKRTIAQLGERGFTCNINLLGEAVLGDAEADRRLERTRELLSRPEVDYVSAKVSAVASGLTPWGHDEGVNRLITRLTPLYEAAAKKPTAAFINLDMEEYHDLRTTIEVFTRILSQPQFKDLTAGIVVQAYLPDALEAMQELQTFAAERVANGGAPIKVRVVKGANLPMERVDAAIHGWPLATHLCKSDTDTHYKRLLRWALTPERVVNVRIGVAGHNLFDIAFAHLLAGDRGITDGLDFEMLLGMAPAQAERVQRDVGAVRLYVPVVFPRDFDSAMSYLVRRLEEAGNPQNIMSALDELGTSQEMFAREQERFSRSMANLDETPPVRRRIQDRAAVAIAPSEVEAAHAPFANAPDTDPSTPENQAWLRQLVARIGAAEDSDIDELAKFRVPTVAAVDAAVAAGRTTGVDWAATAVGERAAVLRVAAGLLEERRGALLEVMAVDAGKVFSESDSEVSEAIDFARYYAEQCSLLDKTPGATFVPAALTVVTPPWNFPLAIPAGSTLAALAAGSPVILKPAPQVEHIAAALANALWDAGVPRGVLQLALVPEDEAGKRLISHPDVERVVLTGAFDTAAMFRTWRSDLHLLAETSGKNAMVITPSADVDLAVADLVQSAFGHAGQKCSAASLAILVGSMGHNKRFFRQLEDATRSLIVDYPVNLEATVGPLIESPGDKLREGLTELGDGEKWLVEPVQLDDTGRLWSPGIRIGVRRGANAHRTEFFGPVLSIMRADSLAQAVAFQNDTDYGLTAGLQSLDPEELAYWLDNVEAGNLYVNRGITGAIVSRQPFGGWKRSAVGPGSKAGGPHYLWGFGTWTPAPLPSADLAATVEYDTAAMLNTPAGEVIRASREVVSADEASSLGAAFRADEREWVTQFGTVVDVAELGIERNLSRYRALPVTIRAGGDARLADVVRVAAAGLSARGIVDLSTAVGIPLGLRRALEGAGVAVYEEPRGVWLRRLADDATTRVRLVSEDADAVVRHLGPQTSVTVYAGPVTLASGPEMLPFLREQSVTITAHRYGNPHRWSEEVLPSTTRVG